MRVAVQPSLNNLLQFHLSLLFRVRVAVIILKSKYCKMQVQCDA